ncbi:MAG: rRNA cytosine-C5-methyltransferase [Bacteroidales bacterium]
MNLPLDFISGMQRLLGDEYLRFASALDTPPPVSVRINPLKCCCPTKKSEPVPWLGEGAYLKERIPFTFDPLFHAGLYYVQEASSMFVGHILKELIKDPVSVLDLCAAPGGKTTLALSTLPEGSFVVSNEYVASRANILAENIMKWGYTNCAVTNNTPTDYGRLQHSFDVILVDAPCSGEGMFRKEPDALAQWSKQGVLACATRQKSILSNVWSALRPGGLLVYSTCTYNITENEDIAEYLHETFGAEPLPVLDLPESWCIMPQLKGDIPFYRFMPQRTIGEGFSVTILRKPKNETYMPYKPKFKKAEKAKITEEIKRYIQNPKHYDYTLYNDTVFALPLEFSTNMQLLAGMNILHYGIAVASCKGGNLQPHQSLALSSAFNSDASDSMPLSLAEARSYLRRESLTLPNIQHGYRIVTFLGRPLGWIKCVGTRANNLYPQEWRIRSRYTPDNDNILGITLCCENY